MNPDLILLDVVLPDMEGYELFEKIKEKDENHAPVIFITSRTVNRMNPGVRTGSLRLY